MNTKQLLLQQFNNPDLINNFLKVSKNELVAQ